MLKCLAGQAKTQVQGCPALVRLHVRQHRGVIGRIHHRCHTDEVFGRGPYHARPADVDVSPGLFNRYIRSGNGLFEGVQIADNHVNGNAVGTFQILLMSVVVSFGQQSQVDSKIKGFDKPSLGFRLARILRHPCQAGICPGAENLLYPGKCSAR